jgi:hypothetical protein
MMKEAHNDFEKGYQRMKEAHNDFDKGYQRMTEEAEVGLGRFQSRPLISP